MSIIRVVKDSRVRYLLTDAEPHLRTDISWEARGLHAYLMLMPDKWEVRMGQLLKAGPAKKDKLQRMINELKSNGYINRVQVHDKKTGKFVTITEVYERVDLNPGETPIYGGTGDTVTENPVTDRDGFTVTGKPGDISNTNISKYKGDFRHFETPGMNQDDSRRDAIHEITVALGTVCQGFANLLVPDNCPFYAAATILLSAGITEEQVLAFRQWWQENGDYEGKPALKSLMNRIENMIAGINPGKRQQKSRELTKATKELDLWLARRLGVTEFSSPHTLKAIQRVGEATIRGANTQNKRIIFGRFEEEFEKAKRDATTN